MAPSRSALVLALCACLASSASAAFEEFNNTGAPPFIQGATYEVNATDGTVLAMGWLNGDSNQFTAPEGEDAVVTTTATYKSWECGEVSGSYVAVLEKTWVDADGNNTTKEVCEVGVVDVYRGMNFWAQSDEECPGPEDVDHVDVLLTSDPADNECETERWTPRRRGRRGHMHGRGWGW